MVFGSMLASVGMPSQIQCMIFFWHLDEVRQWHLGRDVCWSEVICGDFFEKWAKIIYECMRDSCGSLRAIQILTDNFEGLMKAEGSVSLPE